MKSNERTKLVRRWAKAYLFTILGLIIVPFVVQREFYPFMQFVMFAGRPLDDERFEVICEGKVFQPETIGIDAGKFHVICRRYWHNHDSHGLMRELSRIARTNCLEMRKISGSDTISSRLGQ